MGKDGREGNSAKANERGEGSTKDKGKEQNGQPKQGRVLRVWVVGHSYVHWARARAMASGLGENLGFAHRLASIRWIGKRGMRWGELVATIQQTRKRWGPPDALIIHLGGNDIGALPLKELEDSIKGVISWLKVAWPQVQVIWSNIISRIRWRNTNTQRAGYRSRRRVNQVAAKIVREIGGRVLEHPLIVAKREELFRADGVHLNEEGNDRFLEDIRMLVAELAQVH
ncbi:uncharacterized protein LOC128651976 isoform X2 [Bombina bombina]|uniref:uncharacterized protein LOC128651976 isoform X2 n=1 Tax=Bombina bombina TaxID=8345 RepID=UPI00235AEB31|nr:uncharacterized protein LOC128651976 isoform X2 [Bombina bombina]